MIIVRSLLVFGCVLMLIACSGTKKVAKNEILPENKIIKMTTSKGVMLIELYDKTPKHKANFIKLAEEGFYDSLLFHRVISGFMVQGGDPNSKHAKKNQGLGNGGPGYTVPAEFDSTLFHKKGALSAARLGDAANPKKASSGSQFYIVQGKKYNENQIKNMEANIRRCNPKSIGCNPNFTYTEAQRKTYGEIGGTPFLDGGYTVFGEVIYGLDVIDKIAAVKTARGDRPLEDERMKVEVVDRRNLEKIKAELAE